MIQEKDAELYKRITQKILDVNRQFEGLITAADEEVEAVLVNPDALPTLEPELAEITTTTPMINWYSTRSSNPTVTIEEVTVFMEGSGDADQLILSSKIEVSKVDLSGIEAILGDEGIETDETDTPTAAALIGLPDVNTHETISLNGGYVVLCFMLLAVSLIVLAFLYSPQNTQSAVSYSPGQ